MSGVVGPGTEKQGDLSFLISGKTGQRINGPVAEDSDSDTERAEARAERRSLQRDELHIPDPDEEQGTLCYCVNLICTCFCRAISSLGACLSGCLRSILTYCGYEPPTWASSYPLHAACDEGNGARICELVAQGYDVNQPDDRGDTPIHYLFVHHHYELIPDLIKLGANVEEPDSVGKAVLHKVCELDFEVIIDTKKKTWKPAQVGIKHQLGHDEVRLIEVLIGTKPDLDAPDRRGHLPILQASKTGLVHQLAVAGANLNVQDKDGMTPLHFACAKGSLDRVKILCSLSADVTAQDKRGRTPLLTFAAREHFSVAGEDDDIVKIKAIIRAIENVNKLALTAKDNEGNGAWQLAARAQNKQFINALMDKGTAINTKDQNGRTILHGAVAACQHDFVKFLIETCRAEVNMQDNLGRTPLFLLCENRKANRAERQKMARYLQAMGASDKIGTVKCVKTPEGLVANKAGKSYGPNLKELFKEIAPPAKKEEEKKDPKAPGKKAVKPPIIIPGYENAKTVPLPPADDSDHEEAEVAEVAGEKNDGKTAV